MCRQIEIKKQAVPHLDLLALLQGDDLLVPVTILGAFRAHGHLLSGAEHGQGSLVLSAEVTVGVGGRLRQPVPLQSCIPRVRLEVELAVRGLAHQARLDRR